jgi:hypothetical protein
LIFGITLKGTWFDFEHVEDIDDRGSTCICFGGLSRLKLAFQDIYQAKGSGPAKEPFSEAS